MSATSSVASSTAATPEGMLEPGLGADTVAGPELEQPGVAAGDQGGLAIGSQVGRSDRARFRVGEEQGSSGSGRARWAGRAPHRAPIGPLRTPSAELPTIGAAADVPQVQRPDLVGARHRHVEDLLAPAGPMVRRWRRREPSRARAGTPVRRCRARWSPVRCGCRRRARRGCGCRPRRECDRRRRAPGPGGALNVTRSPYRRSSLAVPEP